MFHSENCRNLRHEDGSPRILELVGNKDASRREVSLTFFFRNRPPSLREEGTGDGLALGYSQRRLNVELIMLSPKIWNAPQDLT